jgi:MerR family transcriptional regulator, light-induced transcriptional regulator
MSGDGDTNHTFNRPGSAEASRLAAGRAGRFGGRTVAARPARDMRDALSEAIRSIVLPRLLAARGAGGRTPRESGPAIGEHDIADLLSHVTSPDESIAEAALSALRARAVTRETVLLDLFTPAARRLGDQWLRDQCSFADVMLGIGRLKRLMRSDAMPKASHRRGAVTGRVLIASLPGDQHTLGAAIMEDLFASAGWDTLGWVGDDAGSLETIAAVAKVDIIGISISEHRTLQDLKPLTARLRQVMERRLVGILAGGRAFDQAAGAAADYGVDAIVRNARRAIATAEAVMSARV